MINKVTCKNIARSLSRASDGFSNVRSDKDRGQFTTLPNHLIKHVSNLLIKSWSGMVYECSGLVYGCSDWVYKYRDSLPNCECSLP